MPSRIFSSGTPPLRAFEKALKALVLSFFLGYRSQTLLNSSSSTLGDNLGFDLRKSLPGGTGRCAIFLFSIRGCAFAHRLFANSFVPAFALFVDIFAHLFAHVHFLFLLLGETLAQAFAHIYLNYYC